MPSAPGPPERTFLEALLFGHGVLALAAAGTAGIMVVYLLAMGLGVAWNLAGLAVLATALGGLLFGVARWLRQHAIRRDPPRPRDVQSMLARDGLAAEIRLCAVAAVAVWDADWDRLQAVARLARDRGQPRQDLEETLLQAILFCGFPRVVTAFEQLGAAWPAAAPPGGGAAAADQQAALGRQLFEAIYGERADAVRAMLRCHHQELHDFVLDAAYARILTRPHLSPRVRELLAVATLAAQRQERQFDGHVRGAQRCGATRVEVCEALVSGLGDDAAAAWIRRLR